MHQVNPAYFMTILVPAAQTGKALHSVVNELIPTISDDPHIPELL